MEDLVGAAQRGVPPAGDCGLPAYLRAPPVEGGKVRAGAPARGKREKEGSLGAADAVEPGFCPQQPRSRFAQAPLCASRTRVCTPPQIMAEYIWLGADGQLRSRTEVLDRKPSRVEEAPVAEAQTGHPESCAGVSTVLLRPRKLFQDPFRGGEHVLVLCDTFEPSQVRALGRERQGEEGAGARQANLGGPP